MGVSCSDPRYVGNSPTNFTDPSGKCLVLPFVPLVITGLDLLVGLGAGLLAGGVALIYNTRGSSGNPNSFSPFTPYAPDPERNRLTLGFPRPSPPEPLGGFNLNPPDRQTPESFPRPSQNPTWQESLDTNPILGTSNPPGYPSRSNDPFNHFLQTTGATPPALPEIVIDRGKYPETAQHVEDAIAAGQPDELIIARPGAKGNRKESLKGYPTVPGQDRDEYPPAVFQEGGTGASVRPIDPSDNRGAGSSMGHQLKSYPNGTKVKIVVR